MSSRRRFVGLLINLASTGVLVQLFLKSMETN